MPHNGFDHNLRRSPARPDRETTVYAKFLKPRSPRSIERGVCAAEVAPSSANAPSGSGSCYAAATHGRPRPAPPNRPPPPGPRHRSPGETPATFDRALEGEGSRSLSAESTLCPKLESTWTTSRELALERAPSRERQGTAVGRCRITDTPITCGARLRRSIESIRVDARLGKPRTPRSSPSKTCARRGPVETRQRIRQVQGIVRRRDTPGSHKISSAPVGGPNPVSRRIRRTIIAESRRGQARSVLRRRRVVEPKKPGASLSSRQSPSGDGRRRRPVSAGPKALGDQESDRTRDRGSQEAPPKNQRWSCRLTDSTITCGDRRHGRIERRQSTPSSSSRALLARSSAEFARRRSLPAPPTLRLVQGLVMRRRRTAVQDQPHRTGRPRRGLGTALPERLRQPSTAPWRAKVAGASPQNRPSAQSWSQLGRLLENSPSSKLHPENARARPSVAAA